MQWQKFPSNVVGNSSYPLESDTGTMYVKKYTSESELAVLVTYKEALEITKKRPWKFKLK